MMSRNLDPPLSVGATCLAPHPLPTDSHISSGGSPPDTSDKIAELIKRLNAPSKRGHVAPQASSASPKMPVDGTPVVTENHATDLPSIDSKALVPSDTGSQTLALSPGKLGNTGHHDPALTFDAKQEHQVNGFSAPGFTQPHSTDIWGDNLLRANEDRLKGIFNAGGFTHASHGYIGHEGLHATSEQNLLSNFANLQLLQPQSQAPHSYGLGNGYNTHAELNHALSHDALATLLLQDSHVPRAGSDALDTELLLRYMQNNMQAQARSNGPGSGAGAGTNHRNTSGSLYKTELCRSWSESGTCRYGVKCQFAHGVDELRPIQRHPKYKTEHCRTFVSCGSCKYGDRCRFKHDASIVSLYRNLALPTARSLPPDLGLNYDLSSFLPNTALSHSSSYNLFPGPSGNPTNGVNPTAFHDGAADLLTASPLGISAYLHSPQLNMNQGFTPDFGSLAHSQGLQNLQGLGHKRVYPGSPDSLESCLTHTSFGNGYNALPYGSLIGSGSQPASLPAPGHRYETKDQEPPRLTDPTCISKALEALSSGPATKLGPKLPSNTSMAMPSVYDRINWSLSTSSSSSRTIERKPSTIDKLFLEQSAQSSVPE